MKKKSAGLLLYRRRLDRLEVFLVHPGGPFWSRKEFSAWSIPKGEIEPDEEPLAAAQREFHEETGTWLDGPFSPLSPVRQASGKVVQAWAVEGDLDPTLLLSNTFTMEWPRGSGQVQQYPEVDRGAWFTLDKAAERIIKGQAPLLQELASRVNTP